MYKRLQMGSRILLVKIFFKLLDRLIVNLKLLDRLIVNLKLLDRLIVNLKLLDRLIFLIFGRSVAPPPQYLRMT